MLPNDFLTELRIRGISLWIENDALRYKVPKGAATPEFLSELAKHKQEIIQFLNLANRTQTVQEPILPVSRAAHLSNGREYYQVSSAQKRLYLIQQLDGAGTSYNIPGAMLIEGALDKKRLEEVFIQLIKRHESFRTSFLMREGDLVQEIHPEVDFSIKYRQDKTAAVATMAEDFVRPFDLSEAPLLRMELIQMSPVKHILLYDAHHIISDGVSMGIMLKEFAGLYNGEKLPELKIQYKDFSEWQNRLSKIGFYKRQEEYWREVFKGEIPLLKMPSDYQRPAEQSFSGKRIKFSIADNEASALAKVAGGYKVTLNTMLLALYAVLLSKYSEQREVIIGVIETGRSHRDLENIIGVFINFLPLRFHLNYEDSFTEFLRTAHKVILNAFENKDFPFDQIVENTTVQLTPSRNPLFDTMLILHNEMGSGFNFETSGLQFSSIDLNLNTSKLDFKIDVYFTPGGALDCVLEYNTNLFNEETMNNFAQHFDRLIRLIIVRPEQKLAALDIFTPDEKREIIAKRLKNMFKEPVKLVVSATFTAEPIADYVKWWCSQFGEEIELVFAPYNQVFQELLDPSSLTSANTGINLLLIRFEDWLRDDASTTEAHCRRLERNYIELITILKDKPKPIPYLVGLFPSASHLLFKETTINYLADLNSRWRSDLAEMENVHLLDLTRLAELYNIDNIFDPIKDRAGHLPFSDEFYAATGTMIARKFCSRQKQLFKVIVIDCDNTLWRGVCGEDGALGIKIEVPYQKLQNCMAAKLNEGMLLTLCSKNNEADVWEVFTQNPLMVLKKEHFAGWRINWRPKSENLRELACELSLGLDSFIYLDDSPAECAEVMTNCPEVLTLQLPADSNQIPAFLEHVWAFDRFSVTSEDQQRARMYLAERKRQEVQSSGLTLAEFLKGLALKMSMNLMEPSQSARVAQLTQRTNQFNLSTIRRSEEEIYRLTRESGVKCQVIEVMDRFGDYGLVGVVITREDGRRLFIDTFLLSCRVLGKKVEDAILSGLGRYCRELDVDTIEADFYPTAKNKPFQEFMERTGWQKLGETAVCIKYTIPAGMIPEAAEVIDCYFNGRYEKNTAENVAETEKFSLDHIAIAVLDINTVKEYYGLLGYECGAIINDPLQNSFLMICSKKGFITLELVAPAGHDAPVRRIFERMGETPYHLCYRVRDTDVFLRKLAANGLDYEIVSAAKPAVLFDGKKVTFIFVKNVGLIELLEDENINVRDETNDSLVRIIVPQLDQALQFFGFLGYIREKTTRENLRNILVSTLKKPGAGKLELIAPLGEKIPEYDFLQNNGPHLYQLCLAYSDPQIPSLSLQEKNNQADAARKRFGYGDLSKVSDKLWITPKGYLSLFERSGEQDRREQNHWELNLANEDNLFHKNYLLPLQNYSARMLLNLPVFLNNKIKIPTSVYEAPRDKNEASLAKLFQEVLRVERIGINDNFFEYGGHSLKATILIAKIFREYNVEVPLRVVFSHPTVKKLSAYIKSAEKRSFVAIEPLAEQEYYPVSSAQKRLYILGQLEGVGAAYNIPGAMMVEGRLDRAKLEHAFLRLIARHETLRASFTMEDGEPVQKVHREVEFNITYLDIAAEKAPEIAREFIKPFDFNIAPLLRVCLAQMGENKQLLLVDMHHIVADGTSVDILIRELIGLYEGKELPDLRIQYRDYASWQKELFAKGAYREQEQFWRGIFVDEVPALNLPLDYPRPAIRSFTGNRINFTVGSGLTEGLNRMAKKNEATLYMVLLAAYTVLLAKYSGQEDMVVGSPVAGRSHPDTQDIIGMFINTLAMRNYPSGDKKFQEFLLEVKKNALAAFENQDYPFEELVEKLQLPKDLSRNPIFDTMLVLQNMNMTAVEIEGLRFLPFNSAPDLSRFDLTLNAAETQEGINFEIEYGSALFKQDTIRRMAYHFVNILEQVAGQVNISLKNITVLREEEKIQVLYDFNKTAVQFPRDETIQDLFEEQVMRTPDNIAVVFEKRQLTYGELNKKANQLAGALRSKGVKPDGIVALMATNSLEMVTGILGILKAGGAYLPLDPLYPPERIDYMTVNSKAGILVTQFALKERVGFTDEIIFLEDDSIYQREDTNPAKVNKPADLAYVIYTSGTTGQPKGVMVGHQSMRNAIRWRKQEYQLDGKDNVLQLFSYSFDGFVTSFFTPVVSGSKVVLLNEHSAKDPDEIKKNIVLHQITHFIMVPSLYAIVLQSMTSEDLKPLRIITLAGEKTAPELIKATKEKAPWIELVNEYGPTESTVVTTILRNMQEDSTAIIGKPIPNIQVYVLDKNNNPLPLGIPGELCISGMGLARGYLNNPALTAQKFVPNPFTARTRELRVGCQNKLASYESVIQSFGHESFGQGLGTEDSRLGTLDWETATGELANLELNNSQLATRNSELIIYNSEFKTQNSGLIYKTGDLGRWLSDGNIEFLGRIDHQVKIRGFRIELGEIENRLLKHESIKEAVVLVREDETGNKNLYAYIVVVGNTHACSPQVEITIAELRRFLAKELPEYMIPAQFIQVEKIPLTINGKVDRKALLALEANIGTGVDYVAPRDDLERELVDIWEKILEVSMIGIDDNFFHLGGNSIKAVQVVAALKSYRIGLKDIFEHPTIAALSLSLESITPENVLRENNLKILAGASPDFLTDAAIITREGAGVGLPVNTPRNKVLDNMQPFNDVFYVSCFYNALFPVINYYHKEISSFLIDDIPVYQYDKSKKFLLDITYTSVNGALKILEDLGFKIKTGVSVSNLVDETIYALTEDKPVILQVDCFYERIRADTYQKTHWPHSLLIYGFNTTDKVFHVMEHDDVNSLTYQGKTITMEEVVNSYHGFLTNFLKEDAIPPYLEFRLELDHDGKYYENSRNLLAVYARNSYTKKELIMEGLNALAGFIMNFKEIVNQESALAANVDGIIYKFNEIIKSKYAEKYRLSILGDCPELNGLLDVMTSSWNIIKTIIEKYKYTSRFTPQMIATLIAKLEDIHSLENRFYEILFNFIDEPFVI